MAYTEYNTRRALGARYGRSPELELDKLRLQEEYRLMPERARLAEIKRQSLLADKRREEALDAAETQGMVKSVGNLAKTGMQMYQKSGSTIIGDTAKQLGGSLLGKLGFGGSSASPAYLGAAKTALTGLGTQLGTQIGAEATGLGAGLAPTLATNPALMAEAAGGAAALGGQVAGIGATEAAAAGATAAGEVGATAAAEGAAQGTAAVVGEAVGSVIPWVGVALAADMVDKFFTRAVIDKNTEGDTKHTLNFIADVFNPIRPLFRLIGSHLCTAANSVVGMSKEETEKMKALKDYALTTHKGWINAYLKHGTKLVEAISQQEDVENFYSDLRTVLIEPVCANVDTDIEKAYQIYAVITKMLFRVYMPDFDFKEEE